MQVSYYDCDFNVGDDSISTARLITTNNEKNPHKFIKILEYLRTHEIPIIFPDDNNDYFISFWRFNVGDDINIQSIKVYLNASEEDNEYYITGRNKSYV